MQGKGLKVVIRSVTEAQKGFLPKVGVRVEEEICRRASGGNPGQLWPQNTPDPSFSDLLPFSPTLALCGLWWSLYRNPATASLSPVSPRSTTKLILKSDPLSFFFFLSLFKTNFAWRAAIHGVTRSQTRLSDWTELNHTISCSWKASTGN